VTTPFTGRHRPPFNKEMPPAPSAAKRALCVSEHEEVCASLAARMCLEGYEITAAVGAAQAMEQALAGALAPSRRSETS
jgi:hypothetical protein